jgi:hypothetical protein
MTEPAAETTDPLLAFILSCLTPLLATSSHADAANAARQAIAAYNATAADQLLTIAQVVGFAIAALDNLRLSAAPDISLSLKLKLRGNANALNLSTQRTTKTFGTPHRDVAAPIEPQPDPEAEAAALAALASARAALQKPAKHQPTPQPIPTTPPTQDRKTIWANAMTDIAAECSRNLAQLPPRQRHAEVLRIAALSNTARHLANGGAIPSKADLLSSTAITAIQPA